MSQNQIVRAEVESGDDQRVVIENSKSGVIPEGFIVAKKLVINNGVATMTDARVGGVFDDGKKTIPILNLRYYSSCSCEPAMTFGYGKIFPVLAMPAACIINAYRVNSLDDFPETAKLISRTRDQARELYYESLASRNKAVQEDNVQQWPETVSEWIETVVNKKADEAFKKLGKWERWRRFGRDKDAAINRHRTWFSDNVVVDHQIDYLKKTKLQQGLIPCWPD